MPFSFQDKQKPSDKYRGKTRDEFLDDVRDKFDREKRMFFEKGPPWDSMPSAAAGFSRGGFFDDDMMPRGGRGDIRSHLDDLAQRHPEFAAQLRGPAWGSEMWAGDDDGATSSHASSTSETRQDREQSDEPGPLRGRPRNNLPKHGLHNTVPDMGQRQADEMKEEARSQRSWSAPPDTRQPGEPQRFVSRININPVNPDDGAGGPAQQPTHSQASDNQGKPPPAPKTHQQPQQQQQQQPQQPKAAGTVRHIPIFVEGRDEPILPKNVDAEAEPSTHQQHFTAQAQHHFNPQNKPFPQQKRPFQSPQNNPPQHKQPNRSFNTSPKPFQQPSMHPNFPSQQGGPFAQQYQQQPPQQQQQQYRQQPPQQQHADVPTDSRPKTPEPPRPKVANDPISKVQAIQKEVDALKEQVERYSGNSRQEKGYIYLDEMLTRNLIKLDDIETEGKENIRVARKEAIRSIQQCINILEGKAPLPADKEQSMEESQGEVTGEMNSLAVASDCPAGEASTAASEVAQGPMDAPNAGCVAVDTSSPMEVEEKTEPLETSIEAGSTAEQESATPTKTEEEKPKD